MRKSSPAIHQHPQIPVRNDGRDARFAFDQAELAEGLPGLQTRKLDDVAVRLGAKYPGTAGQNYVELSPKLALLADDAAVLEIFFQQGDAVLLAAGEMPEQRDLLRDLIADLTRPLLAQAPPERAPLLEHHLEGASRHAQQAAIGHRPDARRPSRPVGRKEALLPHIGVDF